MDKCFKEFVYTTEHTLYGQCAKFVPGMLILQELQQYSSKKHEWTTYALVCTRNMSGLPMHWFVQETWVAYLCTGLYKKHEWPTYALVCTRNMSGLPMHWFAQETWVDYLCTGLHKKHEWPTYALVCTRNMSGLPMHWFVQETWVAYLVPMHWFAQETRVAYLCTGLYKKHEWPT